MRLKPQAAVLHHEMGYSVNRKEKVMIQHKRDRLLACAAWVRAIDDWPEDANASLLGPADTDEDLVSRQEEFRRKIPFDDPGKRKSRWRSTIGPFTSHIETSSSEAYIYP